MKVAPKPANEEARLEELKSYDILDTLPEKDFDDLTFLASEICQTPMALITLVEEERQWFKSKVGIEGSETSRRDSFCSHTIIQNEVMVVPDSLKDERFADNPLVTAAPHVRFYAGAPLKTAAGHNLGALCVVDNQPRNITTKQMEALQSLARQVVNQMELRRSLRQLKESENELKHSKTMAEDAYRVKGEFLANMSHEIRTPMNGIIGLTELLQNSKLDREQTEKLRMIQTCGQTLLDLINEILDFSKLEAGKVQIEKRGFNFKEMVTDTIKMCEVNALKKGLEISCTINQNVPDSITGDSTRIKQVLMNLLSNAIKFTSKGNVNIEIKKLENGAPQKCEIQISVKDSGVGIPLNLQHRLFKSFSQVDASTTRQFGGTGLGLAISKGLCEKMNGRIWFESTPQVGSTFHFTIQAEICDMPIAVKKQPDIEVTMVPTVLKILIAEDNRINQMVINGLLQQFGHETDVATDGFEVLTMLENKNYDVLFLDCHMPQMNGFETTQNILADPQRYGRPKIVALTASVLEEDRTRCLAAGMDEFLSKPVRTTDLKRVLMPIQKKNFQQQAPTVKEPPTETVTTKVAPPPVPEVPPAGSEVDLNAFYKAFAKIEHIMGTVIKQFLQDYPVILKQMDQAIKTKDYKALHISAHSLKGMLSEVYAPTCHKLAYEIEQMGKTEKLENAPQAYEQLSQKLKILETDLLQIKSIPTAA